MLGCALALQVERCFRHVHDSLSSVRLQEILEGRYSSKLLQIHSLVLLNFDGYSTSPNTQSLIIIGLDVPSYMKSLKSTQKWVLDAKPMCAFIQCKHTTLICKYILIWLSPFVFVIKKLPGAWTELAENFPTFMFQTSVEPKGLPFFNFSLEDIVQKDNSSKVSIFVVLNEDK